MDFCWYLELDNDKNISDDTKLFQNDAAICLWYFLSKKFIFSFTATMSMWDLENFSLVAFWPILDNYWDNFRIFVHYYKILGLYFENTEFRSRPHGNSKNETSAEVVVCCCGIVLEPFHVIKRVPITLRLKIWAKVPAQCLLQKKTRILKTESVKCLLKLCSGYMRFAP